MQFGKQFSENAMHITVDNREKFLYTMKVCKTKLKLYLKQKIFFF